MRDDHPVSWEWRKGRKVEERERERTFEGYKARFEGSIQYRAFTSDPWSERRGNHLASSKKNRYRGCGVVKSTFNEDARRWETRHDILSFFLVYLLFPFYSSPPPSLSLVSSLPPHELRTFQLTAVEWLIAWNDQWRNNWQ